MGPQSGRRLLPSENVSVSVSLLSFPLQEPENLSGAAPGWHGRLCGGGGGGHIAGLLLQQKETDLNSSRRVFRQLVKQWQH